jgi:hypothetical protein
MGEGSDRGSAPGLGLGFGSEGEAARGEVEAEAIGGAEVGKGKNGIPRGRGERRGAGWERRPGGAVASSRQREGSGPGRGLARLVVTRARAGGCVGVGPLAVGAAGLDGVLELRMGFLARGFRL